MAAIVPTAPSTRTDLDEDGRPGWVGPGPAQVRIVVSVGHTARMEFGVFDQAADALHGLVTSELGALHTQARRWGLKAWFDVGECPRVHYEAQVIPAKLVPDADVLAIEVGFHAEFPKPAENVAVMAPLVESELAWRAALDDTAMLGPFLGRSGWQRLSETWPDPDLSDPEICFELADRLATYLNVIEPLRR